MVYVGHAVTVAPQVIMKCIYVVQLWSHLPSQLPLIDHWHAERDAIGIS